MSRLRADRDHRQDVDDGREPPTRGPATTGTVVDLAAARRARQPDPETYVPGHLARPMADDVRRRNAERGIGIARRALAKARMGVVAHG